MLLPVRTMFAHPWRTFPQCILRAFPEGVADRMEWLVNWINPGIVSLGVPVATALTRRVNGYTMMIIGTPVSAAPTFLLAHGATGLYSGYMLATFGPAGVPRAELHTEARWVIYGCIAMISPVGLWLARKGVRAGSES